MRKFTSVIAALGLAVTTLLIGTGTTNANERNPRLNITSGPGGYTGGSALTLEGHLGVPGRKRIKVERNLNRVGDPWRELAKPSRGWSRPDGSFTITAPAPAMWDVKYRVTSGNDRHSTPGRVLFPHAQEAILTQRGDAVAGRPFTLHLDTIGADLTTYRDLPGVRLPGRRAILQERVNPWQWRRVDTTTLNNNGQATFNVTVPSTGTKNYRVRLTPWRQNGDNIGWHASYPLQVRIGQSSSGTMAPDPVSANDAGSADTAEDASDELAFAGAAARPNPLRRHAAQVHNWARQGYRFSFDWALGESLDSNPDEGRAMRGRWLPASNGTGRVTLRNGGMLLSSAGYGVHSGVRGSSWATLQNNSHKRGRWEIRGITTQQPRGGNVPYRMRYELVPHGTKVACAPWSIVMAQTTGPGKPMRFGVRNANGMTWARQVRLPAAIDADSIAVQVTNNHITWFLNGRAIGTVRNKAAIPNQKMAVRVSLAGRGNANMTVAKSTIDWIRSYDLRAGNKATSNRGLNRGAPLARC